MKSGSRVLVVRLAGSVAVLTMAIAGAHASTLVPVIVAAVATMIAAYAPRIGWRLATANVVLVALVAQVCVAWAAPHAPGSFATATLWFWTALGLIHAAVLHAPTRSDAGRRRLVDLALCAIVPLTVSLYFVRAARSGSAPWLGWSMVGDAANNVTLSRLLLVDGGLERAQSNPAPLATVLASTWTAAAAEGQSHAVLVARVIEGSATFSLGAWIALGFLASALALRSAPSNLGIRLALAVGAGCLPWLWFLSGYAIRFGFLNVAPALLVVLLGWWCWLQQRSHPVGAVTGLILASWAAAVAWVPLVIIPGAWLVSACVLQRQGLRRQGRQLAVPAAALIGAVGYALTVTLRDFAGAAGALTADGAYPPISAFSLVLLVAILVLAAWRVIRSSDLTSLGFLVGLAGGAVGIGYLLHTRSGLPHLWGYYPAKLTWLLVAAALLIAPSAVHPAVSALGRRWRGNGVIVTVMVPLVVAAVVSPPKLPGVLESWVTPMALNNERTYDRGVALALQILERRPHSLVSHYFGPEGDVDRFIDFWLIQMAARNLRDPVRAVVYPAKPSDPAWVCRAAAAWGGSVSVWTRHRELRDDLTAECQPGTVARVLIDRRDLG